MNRPVRPFTMYHEAIQEPPSRFTLATRGPGDRLPDTIRIFLEATSYWKVIPSPKPLICSPSAETATDACLIDGGNVTPFTGSVFATELAMVSIGVDVPVAGSKETKLVVVTTRARPSTPNPTPRGGSARGYNVCCRLVRSITVRTLAGV